MFTAGKSWIAEGTIVDILLYGERIMQVFDDDNICDVLDKLNELYEENQSLNKTNKVLYDENIQLREKLLHFMNLKDDVKYLEEKGVF